MKRAAIIALGLIFLAGTKCFAADNAGGAGKVIKNGSKVTFDYTLYVDGKVADTSKGKKPLEYTQGAGMIIPGLEAQMAGLKVGDTKTIVVKAKDAYGEVNPKAIVDIPKEKLGKDIDPKVGMVLQMQTKDGNPINGVIKKVNDKTITMDFNHPLAGKDLTFDVKIVSID